MTYVEYIQQREKVLDVYMNLFHHAVNILLPIVPDSVWESYYLIEFDEKNFVLELYENDSSNAPFYTEAFPAFILEANAAVVAEFQDLYRYYETTNQKPLVNKEEEYNLEAILGQFGFRED